MKKAIIFLVAFFLAVLIGGIFFLSKTIFFSSEKETPINIPIPTLVWPTVSEEVKVFLLPRKDKKAVDLTVEGFSSEIESIEYELTYLTGSGLPRGVTGEKILKGEKKLLMKDITLGSCSAGGRCTYDEGVTSIEVVLKFKSSRSVSIFKKTFPL